MEHVVYILAFLVMVVNCGADFECRGEECKEMADDNKFAQLFQQMMARNRDIISKDCQIFDDCPPGFECSPNSGKCKSKGPKRTKIPNFFVRY